MFLVSIYFFYSKYGNGVNFFPRVDAEDGKIVIYARGNLSIDEKYIFLSKKALTASSFAAFNNEGDVPPESREALDILILGNFFKSGLQKFNCSIFSKLKYIIKHLVFYIDKLI